MTWYGFFRALCKPFVHTVAQIEVSGVENIPREGPMVLVGNHQSILDPIFVQVLCPRPLHTLTKSTKFSGAFYSWIMPRLNAIPTRRFRVDPQVVRVALRTLAAGKALGIYPEGERSWDSALQPFRRGTVRLLLKAGVPVIPCGIAGTYDVWPRWSRGVRRRRVRVSFGRPLNWPAMHSRAERDAHLESATEALRRRIAELSTWTPSPSPNPGTHSATKDKEPHEAEEALDASAGAEPSWLTSLLD